MFGLSWCAGQGDWRDRHFDGSALVVDVDKSKMINVLLNSRTSAIYQQAGVRHRTGGGDDLHQNNWSGSD
jgi:hypothetical protein